MINKTVSEFKLEVAGEFDALGKLIHANGDHQAIKALMIRLNQELVDFSMASALSCVDEARNIIGALGMFRAMAQRYWECCPKKHEYNIDLSVLEGELLRLSDIAGTCPRETAYNVWLPTDGVYLFFTGLPMERIWAESVRDTQTRNRKIVKSVRPLLNREIELFSETGIESVLAAKDEARSIRTSSYRMFKGTFDDGSPRFTAEFFTEDFRNYLNRYTIGGVEYKGANPAHLDGQWLVDLSLGFEDEEHCQHIRQHLIYCPQEVRDEIQQHFKLPSLINIYDEQVRTVSGEAIFKASWNALKGLYDEVVMTTNFHRGLVTQYLEKHAKSLSQEQIKRLPSNPFAGVGGKPFQEELDRIRKMRIKKNRFLKRKIEMRI